MTIVVLVVGLAIAGAITALAVALARREPQGSGGDAALLAAKLDGLPQAMAATREQLTGLYERVGSLEQNTGRMRDGLMQTGALATGIREATELIRQELARAHEGLGQLHATAQSRQELEELTARSIRRLEAVIAGTSAKGAAGENICELVFAQLPAEWQERDFRVGNRTVEFGLRLPNRLVVPIDSKWPATPLLEDFLACEEPAEQQRLKAQIQQAVLAKAREVRKYLDPGLTTDYGMAVVPDAVYDLSGDVLAEAMQLDVMLVSQSMFVSHLMLLVQSAMRDSRDIDVEKLAGYLRSAEQGLDALSKEIEGRLSNAIVMLGNSRDSLRMHTARVSAGLAAIAVPGGVEVATEPEPKRELVSDTM